MVKVNKAVYFAPQNGTNFINMFKLEERAGIAANGADSGRSDTRSGGKLGLRHTALGKQFTQINFYHATPPKMWAITSTVQPFPSWR